MLTNQQFYAKKNDVGGYIPEIWFYNQWRSTTHYWNDKLMAVLLGTTAKLYSDFLKYYGAIGPRNWATYFSNEADCVDFLEVLKYLYDEIYVNGKSWLSVTRELLNKVEQTLRQEDRTNINLGLEKTYYNEQSYQGTRHSINYDTLDSKDANTGQIMTNPFKPGRSKKQSHYTFL